MHRAKAVAQRWVITMIDQSVRLVIDMTAHLTAFTVNLALTGNLPYALDLLTESQESKQDDETAIENLFWD